MMTNQDIVDLMNKKRRQFEYAFRGYIYAQNLDKEDLFQDVVLKLLKYTGDISKEGAEAFLFVSYRNMLFQTYDKAKKSIFNSNYRTDDEGDELEVENRHKYMIDNSRVDDKDLYRDLLNDVFSADELEWLIDYYDDNRDWDKDRDSWVKFANLKRRLVSDVFYKVTDEKGVFKYCKHLEDVKEYLGMGDTAISAKIRDTQYIIYKDKRYRVQKITRLNKPL